MFLCRVTAHKLFFDSFTSFYPPPPPPLTQLPLGLGPGRLFALKGHDGLHHCLHQRRGAAVRLDLCHVFFVQRLQSLRAQRGRRSNWWAWRELQEGAAALRRDRLVPSWPPPGRAGPRSGLSERSQPWLYTAAPLPQSSHCWRSPPQHEHTNTVQYVKG